MDHCLSVNQTYDNKDCHIVNCDCEFQKRLKTCYFIQDNIEVVKAENGILRRKLQSKTEGLMILSKEVEMLRNELNQLKVLNEHLMNPVRQLTFCKIMDISIKR